MALPNVEPMLGQLGDLGFPGVEGIPAGETPTDVPFAEGLQAPQDMALDSLDDIYADWSQAAKAEGAGAWSAWAQAGVSSVGTLGAMIPGVGPMFAMAAPALNWLLEKLGQRSAYNAARSQYERCKRLEALLIEALEPPSRQGRIVASVTVAELPAYADCNDPIDVRRRTVVTPQSQWAPWTWSLNKDGVAFPEHKGNCGKGMALTGCGRPPGTGNNHRRGADGSPCSGGAQFTALLWPWWCGNGPPRPAPFVKRGDLEKDVNGLLQMLQSAMLRDPVKNAQLDIQKIIDMEQELYNFTGSDMVVHNAKESMQVTLAQVEAAQALCAAAINARVSFLKSRDFLSRIEGYVNAGNASIDGELHVLFGRPRPGAATATRPGFIPPEKEWPAGMVPVPFMGKGGKGNGGNGLPGWMVPTQYIFVPDPNFKAPKKPKRAMKSGGNKKPKRAMDVLASAREPVLTGVEIQNPDAKPDAPARKPVGKGGGGKSKSSALPLLIGAGVVGAALVMGKNKR